MDKKDIKIGHLFRNKLYNVGAGFIILSDMYRSLEESTTFNEGFTVKYFDVFNTRFQYWFDSDLTKSITDIFCD